MECLVLHLPTPVQTSVLVLAVCQLVKDLYRTFPTVTYFCSLKIYTPGSRGDCVPIRPSSKQWRKRNTVKFKFYFRFRTSRTNYASAAGMASFPPMTAALFQCLRFIQPINLDVLDDVWSLLVFELRVSKSCSHRGS